MIFDIFSSFDDHNFVIINITILVWIPIFLAYFIIITPFWVNTSNIIANNISIWSTVDNLVNRSNGNEIGGTTSIFISLSLSLICFNILGLVPYLFSTTSHLSINLSISCCLWLITILISLSYDSVTFISHFQPTGSPSALNPFLCLIELVSNLVRPITLSVRLTANISTGHILIALLGSGFVSSNIIIITIILIVGLFYFIFEIGVSAVQSYIFTLLPILYVDEHPNS